MSVWLKNLVGLATIFITVVSHGDLLSTEQTLNKYYNPSQYSSVISKTTTERIGYYANGFFIQHALYMESPLGEGELGEISKAPLYRFDGFDCTTFVETVLGLSFSNSPEEFKKHINQIRYKHGVVSYETRNHFPSVDWIPNNTKKGFVKDITGSVGGRNTRWSQTWIEKGAWLRKKGPQFEAMAQKFKTTLGKLPYIAKEDLLEYPELLERIPSVSIFHIVRPNWNLKNEIGTELDVSHMGFLIRENGVLYMIHASNGAARDGSDDYKKVKKEPFIDYVQRVMMASPTTAGVNLLSVEGSVEGSNAANITETTVVVTASPKTTQAPASSSQRTPASLAEIPSSEVVGPGVLKPTVYFFPVLDEDKNPCSDETKKTLHGAGGKVLANVCPKTEQYCSGQGSCGVIQKGEMKSYNIIGKFSGQERYFLIGDQCQMGYGVNNICLDPYYTLAADLTIYKPGEVIFVPAVVGLDLPDGSKHNGFFIIRDRGHGVEGYGRFDFFSGKYSWRNPENPFKKLRLGDVNTNIPYYRISGETAKKILQERSYPNLPGK